MARRSGISARMLRHYDSVGLVPPTGRTAAGYREYSEADLQRLFHVESLRSLGLSLVEVQRALDDPAFAPSDVVDRLVTATRERIAREEELLHRLQRVRSSGPERWADALHVVSLMRELQSGDPSRRQTSALSTAGSGPSHRAATLAEALLAETDPNVAGALRWAVERSDAADEALAVLVPALDSPEGPVRRRAVATIAELAGDRAGAVLTGALDHTDQAVRHTAALALGTRGELGAVPVLTEMVVGGHLDVDAAETLGSLARRHDTAGSLAGEIAEEIRKRRAGSAARIRLAQALGELPAAATRPILDTLSRGADADVARIATYLLQLSDEQG
ncbi:HEAT repeat domain-containing protein [Pseudonocardia sediminis]|uniref:HEAT repeat domain-containing protein n=1 Tax=Pseudonocardia sediminis TaxID=1397368 RepID=UPI001F5F4676|nr:HEAT repeat domain-containing protein [Pseudonocardia sediminis]